MLERVHVQPELVALRIADSRARHAARRPSTTSASPSPVRVERDPATGELTVLAEFITGSRLSDLLEATADAAIVPGVDVALGYLLESLPALTLLHTIAGITHGLIDAPAPCSRRTVRSCFSIRSSDRRSNGSTSRASVCGRGSASRLPPATARFSSMPRRTSHRWRSAPSRSSSAATSGLDEYPDALPSLLMEVIEVAQIRGSAAFATGLQRFLQRSLPLPGRRPYATADEAVADVRQLVRRDIGVDVCRQAVVDFAAQMDACVRRRPMTIRQPRRTSRPRRGAHHRTSRGCRSSTSSSTASITRRSRHRRRPRIGTTRPATSAKTTRTRPSCRSTIWTRTRQSQPERDTDEIYDLPPLDEAMAEENMLSRPTTPPSAPRCTASRDPIPAVEEAAPSHHRRVPNRRSYGLCRRGNRRARNIGRPEPEPDTRALSLDRRLVASRSRTVAAAAVRCPSRRREPVAEPPAPMPQASPHRANRSDI